VFQWAVQSTEYSDSYVFCTVHCDIIMQHEPMRCAIFKLILQFNFSIADVFYVLNCPETEPMRFGTRRRCQKLKNWKYYFEKCAFLWFMLHKNILTLRLKQTDFPCLILISLLSDDSCKDKKGTCHSDLAVELSGRRDNHLVTLSSMSVAH
jgi:hypothetical protein